MALAYRASGTFTDASFTTAGFAFPAGMADGDFCVLPVQVRGTGATATIDQGWTDAPGSPVIRSSSFRTHFFVKYIPTAAGEVTPTVTVTVSGAIRGRISAFSGGSATTQLDVAIVTDDGPAVTVVPAPSITPVSSGAMVGWVFSTNDDTTLNANSQGTLAYSSNGTTGADGCLALVYELQGSPGASGTCEMTNSTNAPASYNVITFALRPAPVAATSPATALFDDILLDVDIAFGAGPFTPSPTWTRVTEYLSAAHSIEIEHGRQSEGGEPGQPATLTLALNNSITQTAGRRFDPDYTAGPYYGQLNLRTPIRVWVRRDGTDIALFTGHVSSWRQVQVAGSRDGYTAVSAVCVMRLLSQTPMPGSQLALIYLRDDPEVYLPLEEETLGPVLDLSGNGWGGTYSPLTQVQDPIVRTRPTGKAKGLDLSGAVGFDGTITNLSPGSTPENILSLEAWVKITKYDAATLNAAGIVAPFTIDVSGVSSGLLLRAVFEYSPLAPYLASWQGWLRDSSSVLFFGAGGTLELNRTHHVCVTLDDTFQFVRFYLDGQQTSFADVSPLTFEGGSMTPSMYIAVTADESGAVVSHVAAYRGTLSAAEVLQHYEAGIVGANLQTAADRLELLADYAGLTDAGLWDGSAMGTHTFLSPSDFTGSVLDEMRRIVEADQGRLFTDGYGILTAQSRVTDIAPGETAHITSQGTYGDDATTEIRYEDFNREPASEDLLLNILTVNGTEHRDAASVSLYGQAADEANPPIADPTAARAYARSRLDRYADPQPRTDRLTVNIRGHRPAELDTAINTTLGLQLGHRITATIRPASGLGDDIIETVRVEGITDSITRNTWLRHLYLVPAGDAYNEGPFYTIGHATYGRIGTAGNQIPG